MLSIPTDACVGYTTAVHTMTTLKNGELITRLPVAQSIDVLSGGSYRTSEGEEHEADRGVKAFKVVWFDAAVLLRSNANGWYHC